jgi:formylglycine-generating enzyme required for sulfatase activity
VSRSIWLRVVLPCGLLAVLAGLPSAAADVDDSEVDLTLVEGGGGGFSNGVGMKFVRVGRGTFLMGAAKGERGAEPQESPQHEVEISRDFYLGVTEVTQKQYQTVMGANPSAFSKTGNNKGRVQGLDTDDFPVDSTTWHDATKFIEKLNSLPAEKGAGRRYRLPTEAEWEYACRGGHKVRQFGKKAELPFFLRGPSASLGFGDANFDANSPSGGGKRGNALNRTAKVGSFAPNPLGLYDVHGSVWEWCSDWHSATAYQRKERLDPKGPDSGAERVLRSGSFGSAGDNCRTARRLGYSPAGRSEVVGFRVACSGR